MNLKKLLIAENDLTSRLMLSALVREWGYEPIAVEDGEAAWEIIQQDDPPLLLLLDWDMPKLNGIELCKRLRQQKNTQLPYIILLTSRGETSDIVTGLEAGANEYISKPVENLELKARLDVGQRMVASQVDLAATMSSLQLTGNVFAHTLEGVIITDSKSCILEVNDAFTNITGYSRDEVIGKNPRIVSSGHQDKEFYKAMWSKLDNKGSWLGEIWNRRKNGEVYAEMLNINAVTDKKNNIKNYVAIFSDITIQKNSLNKLEHIAHHDALTNLPNRMLLEDRLEQAVFHAQRHSGFFALAFIDLDGFKMVNDTYGHNIGDQLLINISHQMKQTVRESDTVARIGGDEFVIIINDLKEPKDAIFLIEKLLKTISPPLHIDDLELHVSLSIGVSYYSNLDKPTENQLLESADQAMYKAKQAGGNCYRVFNEDKVFNE